MSSLLTNTAAMVALSNLRGINDDMAMTQNRISTGMRVNNASDNAAYWSIATTMRSDNAALGAVKDAIGLGKATVDIAFTAADSSQKIMKEMVAKLTSATSQNKDGRAKIQQDLKALQEQLKTNANSAVFNGDNWLKKDVGTDDLTPEITGSFTRDANGNATLETIKVDLTKVVMIDTATGGAGGILSKDLTADINTKADAIFTGATAANLLAASGLTTISIVDFDISQLENNDTDNAVLKGLIQMVDTQSKAMTDAATTLGSAKARVDMQLEFVNTLTDAVDRGIGQLVDADMNAESTRLKALQTQQQLGIQALSIANSGSQNILSLFR